jgi:hypothetical protein
MIEGVDYSYSRPDLGCLVRAGKRFVLRYLSHDSAKALSAGEVQALRAAGLAIGVVFEDAAGRATQGYAAGQADAAFAAQQLVVCGLPANLPIYFAVDQDVTDLEVLPYFEGVSSVIGEPRTGVYGGYRACDGLSVGYIWQTYAWSGGQVLADADLYQYQNGVTLCGATVDLTRALSADPGLWGFPGSTASSSEDSRVAYAVKADGTAALVFLGSDHQVYWCLDPGGVEHLAHNGPSLMQPQPPVPMLSLSAAWRGDRLELVGTDQSGSIWVQYYPNPNGAWSGWDELSASSGNALWRTDPDLLRGPQGPAGPAGTVTAHDHAVTVSGVTGQPQ